MKSKNASVIFIFVTVLVDVIGLGVIIPVIPELIKNLTGAEVSEASVHGGQLLFAFALTQFIFSPLMGELSDRFGRRPVLLISLFGLAVDYVFHAYAPSLGWLFLGRVLAGACGASFTVANSYIADISAPSERAKNFGLIGAAFGLGFIIGPMIGGIASKWGLQAPFLIAAGLAFLNFVYGLVVLPESLPKEKRRKMDVGRMVPFGSLKHLFKYKGVVGLIAAIFLVYIAHQSIQSVWTFFCKYQFDWSEEIIGYSLGVAGLLTLVVQGGLVGPIVKKAGKDNALMLGLIFSGVGLLLFGVATQDWMMFAYLVPFCLGGIATPAMQSIITAQVPESEQGELQGAITSMQSLTTVIGPLLMTWLFAVFAGKNAPIHLPGAPFIAGAIIMVFGMIFAWFALKKIKVIKGKIE